jgi:hypothetical protein
MNLDPTNLLVSFLIGIVGAACFVFGRRQGRLPFLMAGVTLMVFPYFVSNLALMGAITLIILVSLWGAVRLGW